MLLADTARRFLYYQTYAEARTTQRQAAFCRLYDFLGYNLHAGCEKCDFTKLLSFFSVVEVQRQLGAGVRNALNLEF